MELRRGGGGGVGGGGGRRRRGGALSKEALLCWVLFSLLFSVYALFTRHDHVHIDLRSFRTNSYTHQRRLFNRRELSAGPGSYPPRCASKCGDCTPCSPVHVPVPPGTPVIAEYYPEAWRCKCGNKLYMP